MLSQYYYSCISSEFYRKFEGVPEWNLAAINFNQKKAVRFKHSIYIIYRYFTFRLDEITVIHTYAFIF